MKLEMKTENRNPKTKNHDTSASARTIDQARTFWSAAACRRLTNSAQDKLALEK
jgi:hypothetical protein